MATIDMTHRKLNFPPRFLPYLEKHRIFELFHECVEMLVQIKPKDHIQFLKNVLPCAAMKKNKQRIVFISPIKFDRKLFSELLADCLEIQNIAKDYLEMLTREKLQAERKVTESVLESVEEESCICRGEGEGEYPFTYMHYPTEESYAVTLPPSLSESLVEEEEPYQEPCVCVCPCVAQNEEKEQEEKDRTATTQENNIDNNLTKLEGEDYPCEPQEAKNKKVIKNSEKKDQVGSKFSFSGLQHTGTTISSSEAIEIDFKLLAECELGAKGWILQDFPSTGDEAKKLNALGVIPTHALRIIYDEEEETNDEEYKLILNDWMRAYKYVPVTEIKIGDRDISEFVKDMCSFLSVMPHRHPPMLPRIVLIGSRGSGTTTQGKKLAQKYGIVHVEFEIVIAQALQQDDNLCQLYKIQLATRPDPELEAFILERALLTSACRNRGWVLTGYPTNIDQMRMLDILATPPNRVLFLEVPAKECFVRLYYRKIDPCLGDEYKIPKIQPCGMNSYETPDLDPQTAERLVSHPRNNKKQIIHDIEQYVLNKKDMMIYCGKTASFVDGNQTIDKVFELIEQILINPAPAQPPRDPLAINYGIDESHERLKKFRLASGLYFNNLFLNPPERLIKIQ